MREELINKEKLDRQVMALRVAKEFQDGDMVNLGIGIPSLCANFVPAGREVIFQSENGLMGFGEITLPGEGDLDLVNASGQTVHPAPGMCVFDNCESFVMIRGGHLDITVMGAYQVSEKGDLCNYIVPARQVGTIGGAMDLAFGAKKVIIAMNHINKEGDFRIKKEPSYEITAPGCVNMVVTDVAVIEVTDDGMVLREYAPGWTPEEVQEITEPTLIIPSDCCEITLA